MTGQQKTTIRVSTDQQELEQLYRLRAKVFFGEKILNQGVAPTIIDERDSWPETRNLVVVTDDGEVVGGARVVFPSATKIPAKTKYFDFLPYLPDGGRKSATGGLLTLDPAYRSTSVGSMLVRTMIFTTALGGMDRLCGSARPVLTDHFSKLGFRVIAEQFDHPVERVPVVPVIADIARAEDREKLRSILEPCLLYTSPSPRDATLSRMPSSA